MKPLSWKEYMGHFDEWADSTRASYVSRIVGLESARETDVADIVANIYNETAASKLVNMAIDAGIRFSSDDISVIEFAVNSDTLERAKKTVKKSIWGSTRRREERKRHKEEFWQGAGEVMLMDVIIDDIFGKKK